MHSGRSYIVEMVAGSEAGKRVRSWMTTKVVPEQVNGPTLSFQINSPQPPTVSYANVI